MTLYCDGSGFNGKTSSFCVMKEDNLIMHEVFENEYTNNEMEYRAMIEALKTAQGGDIVCSDSQLVVYQILGKYKVKALNLQFVAAEARELMKVKNVQVKWIGRDANLAGLYLEKH